MKSYSTCLVYAGLLIVAANTASAQAAPQVASAAPTVATSTVVLQDGKPIGPAEPWNAKPVGDYDLVVVTSQGMMIANLKIGETAGKLTATLTLLEEPELASMDV